VNQTKKIQLSAFSISVATYKASSFSAFAFKVDVSALRAIYLFENSLLLLRSREA